MSQNTLRPARSTSYCNVSARPYPATEVSRPKFISLSIRDDGRGFDLLKIPPDHLGIRFMQERAEAVNAELTIDSLPGSGAVITVMWEFEE